MTLCNLKDNTPMIPNYISAFKYACINNHFTLLFATIIKAKSVKLLHKKREKRSTPKMWWRGYKTVPSQPSAG